MIVTETAAKTRWCPHSRVIFNAENDGFREINGLRERCPPTHAAASYNRATNPIPLANCLGSGCMAWSWLEAPKDNRRGTCGLVRDSRPLENWDRAAEYSPVEPPAGPLVEVIEPAKVEVLPPVPNGQA